MPRIRFRDEQGNDFEVDPAKITRLTYSDASGGEQEVEGHGLSHGRDDEVEGHMPLYRGRDGQEHEVDLNKVTKIAWTDDDGEHEVEGHVKRAR
jgi:hypothetical protein